MLLLLDAQSELSFPYGGCSIDRLIRVAVQRGVQGIALADRATGCSTPAFVRAATAAGLRAVVGARFELEELDGAELLLYPLTAVGRDIIEAARAAHGPRIAVPAVPAASTTAHVAGLLQTYGSVPADVTPVRQLCQRLQGSLHLAVPGPHTPELARLGRDLDISVVLAPAVRIADAEETPLHRLLVSIRGDHEGHGAVRRSGRPARGMRFCGRHQSLSAASLELPVEAARQAEQLFARLWAAPSAAAVAQPDSPSRLGFAVRDARQVILQRVESHAAAAGVLPPREALERELDALEQRGALEPLAELADLLRRLSGRFLILAVGPGWAGSWIGWGLRICHEPPLDDQEPPWLDLDELLPEIRLEVPAGEDDAVLGALDLLGGCAPRAVRRLRPDEAGRWLARERELPAGDRRALQSLIRGQRAGRHRARGRDLGSLASVALGLAGRPLRLDVAAGLRHLGPLSGGAGAGVRRLDLLAGDAARLPGICVRIEGSSGLAVLMRASGAGWHGSLEGGPRGLDRTQLADLLDGPLGDRHRARLRRLLVARDARDLDGLARCLALETRAADAPAPRIGVREGGAGSQAREILFEEDLLRFLHRAAGFSGRDTRRLLSLARAGRGAELAGLRRRFVLGAVERGHDAVQAERVFGVLSVAAPHLVARPPQRARAQLYAGLARVAAARPAEFMAAILDLARARPAQLAAARRWAALNRVQIDPVDLERSAVLSEVAGAAVGGARRVRLGLVHLPGVSRVAAAVIAAARGDGGFGDRGELLRRLRGRLPEAVLSRLLGTEARGGSGASPGAPGAGRSAGDGRGASGRLARALGSRRRTGPRRSSAEQRDLFAAGEWQGRRRIDTAAMSRMGIEPLARVVRLAPGSRVRVAGEIRELRGLLTRGGRKVASALLADGGQTIDLLITPSLLEGEHDLASGRPTVVEGRLGLHAGRVELLVEAAVPLEMLDRALQPGLELLIPRGFRRQRALRNRLLENPGRSPVTIRCRDRGQRALVAALGRLRVTPSAALLAELHALLGKENVHLVGGGLASAAPAPR